MALVNRRDAETTKDKRYVDGRSFVSHGGHEYLFGRDVEPRRRQVFDRESGRCWNCGAYYGWDYGHMDHIIGGRGPQRCWCLHNLRWSCPKCHVVRHGRYPRFGEKPKPWKQQEIEVPF